MICTPPNIFINTIPAVFYIVHTKDTECKQCFDNFQPKYIEASKLVHVLPFVIKSFGDHPGKTEILRRILKVSFYHKKVHFLPNPAIPVSFQPPWNWACTIFYKISKSSKTEIKQSVWPASNSLPLLKVHNLLLRVVPGQTMLSLSVTNDDFCIWHFDQDLLLEFSPRYVFL